jgi:hypothetical protein
MHGDAGRAEGEASRSEAHPALPKLELDLALEHEEGVGDGCVDVRRWAATRSQAGLVDLVTVSRLLAADLEDGV